MELSFYGHTSILSLSGASVIRLPSHLHDFSTKCLHILKIRSATMHSPLMDSEKMVIFNIFEIHIIHYIAECCTVPLSAGGPNMNTEALMVVSNNLAC